MKLEEYSHNWIRYYYPVNQKMQSIYFKNKQLVFDLLKDGYTVIFLDRLWVYNYGKTVYCTEREIRTWEIGKVLPYLFNIRLNDNLSYLLDCVIQHHNNKAPFNKLREYLI